MNSQEYAVPSSSFSSSFSSSSSSTRPIPVRLASSFVAPPKSVKKADEGRSKASLTRLLLLRGVEPSRRRGFARLLSPFLLEKPGTTKRCALVAAMRSDVDFLLGGGGCSLVVDLVAAGGYWSGCSRCSCWLGAVDEAEADADDPPDVRRVHSCLPFPTTRGLLLLASAILHTYHAGKKHNKEMRGQDGGPAGRCRRGDSATAHW